MRTVALLAILGLGLTADFLGKKPVDIAFFGVDVGDLVSDGANAVGAALNGNVNQAIGDTAEAAADVVGEHQLGVDGVKTVTDALNGASGTQIAEDGANMVGDLTNEGDLVHDGIQTYNDITSGQSLGQDIEDGATVVGDLVGQRGTVTDGIKAINDISSGASGSTLLQDGVSLAGDLTGNQKLASDVNTGISAVSNLVGNSDNGEEQFFQLTEVIAVENGEDDWTAGMRFMF